MRMTHAYRKPEYFIGKAVAPHMTQRVQLWDPAACIQLQLVPGLQRVFQPRLYHPTHYEELREPLQYCLEASCPSS